MRAAARQDGSTSSAAASPAGCSVAQWECIRGTSYVFPNSPLTNAQAVAYNNDGFEVGVHPNTNCSDYTPASLESNFTDQLLDWSNRYSSVPAPTTSRTHCIAWSDWVGTPKVELGHGMRLDTNYYYWPPQWVLNVPGVFTGSGLPMRFADTDGSLIDVYQSTTQMTDESDQAYPFTIDTLLDRALGSTGYYGAFNANMHTDVVNSPGANAIVASAKARGVPVVTQPPDADLARRPQRLDVRRDRVERRPPHLQGRRRRRRDGPARDAPGVLRRRRAEDADARRQPR